MTSLVQFATALKANTLESTNGNITCTGGNFAGNGSGITITASASQICYTDTNNTIKGSSDIDTYLTNATISRNKLKIGIADRIIINDGGGALSEVATLARSKIAISANLGAFVYNSNSDGTLADSNGTIAITATGVNIPSTKQLQLADTNHTISSDATDLVITSNNKTKIQSDTIIGTTGYTNAAKGFYFDGDLRSYVIPIYYATAIQTAFFTIRSFPITARYNTYQVKLNSIVSNAIGSASGLINLMYKVIQSAALGSAPIISPILINQKQLDTGITDADLKIVATNSAGPPAVSGFDVQIMGPNEICK